MKKLILLLLFFPLVSFGQDQTTTLPTSVFGILVEGVNPLSIELI